jgi:hypothetical protein
MSEKKTLIGDDSQIFTGDLGAAEYEGDGAETIADLSGSPPADGIGLIMCVITAIALSGSIFPAGLKTGELFPALGSEVPAAGDKFKVLALTSVADASAWSLNITQSEVDVTKLNDKFKKYRTGKKDASGTLSSIFTQGVSDEAGGIVSRNMKLFKRTADGTTTITDAANQSLYMLGFINKAEVPGETNDFIFCQIYMFNINLGAQSGSAQGFDSSIRLTGIDPVFYSLDAA